MLKLTINGQTVTAEKNELLADVLHRAGFPAVQPCGGRGVCGKCCVTVNGREERACQYRVAADVSVTVPEPETILSETGAQETNVPTDRMALALDIGTTTLALALVSLADGTIVRTATAPNPQQTFGADVMSRIGCCREQGPAALQSAVVTAVNDLIRQLNAPDVKTLYAAGNTAMLHLFFGIDCSAMGAAPYTPVFLGSQSAPADQLGVIGAESVVSLPCAAAFVGADLTAGLGLVGLPPQGRYDLLIDLGTNAEIILFSHSGVVCTSAAAGPCFEGVNISCGMSASAGAIFSYAPGRIQTVGDRPPKGVCGTGLVDVIAMLLADGSIDKTGFMDSGECEIAAGITLTQEDVRQYQLAKAAVCAALMTLLQKQTVSFDEIGRLYIAGGFAAKISIANAVATGLLPASLRDKCVSIGNSSLLGTAKYAFEQNDLSAFVDRMTYVDLAADPVFSDLFMENMSLGECDA